MNLRAGGRLKRRYCICSGDTSRKVSGAGAGSAALGKDFRDRCIFAGKISRGSRGLPDKIVEMPRPRVRPTFNVELTGCESFLSRLQEELARPNAPCVGQLFRHHAVLHMRPEAQHIWSPYLNLELRDDEATPTLYCRFSPHPNVWTGLMACYGLLIMLGLGGLVVGLSQLSLGGPPWALALVPASALVAAFVYGAAFIGQGMSAEQMYELRSLVDDALRST